MSYAGSFFFPPSLLLKGALPTNFSAAVVVGACDRWVLPLPWPRHVRSRVHVRVEPPARDACQGARASFCQGKKKKRGGREAKSLPQSRCTRPSTREGS